MGKQKLQQARVLGGFTLDGVEYNPNDIIEADPRIIKSLGTSVDASKEAVDYCLKQENPAIKQHEYIEPEKQSTGNPDADGSSGDSGAAAQVAGDNAQ